MLDRVVKIRKISVNFWANLGAQPHPKYNIHSPLYKGGEEYLNTWGGMGAPRLILLLIKKNLFHRLISFRS